MVCWVRGHFKNIHGELEFDSDKPEGSAVNLTINSIDIWTGDEARDAHLRSEDFLHTEKHPLMEFKSTGITLIGENEYEVDGELTICGVSKPVTLDVKYLGEWLTPFWEDGVDKGPRRRIGFVATTKINRHDFGVSWNGDLDKGGVVVGRDVLITIDVEALLKE